MKLLANLDINGQEDKIIDKISTFVKTQAIERGVDGVLILFSGYIDSTIVAKITVGHSNNL